MKLIAITSENAGIEEAQRVINVLLSGFDYVHIRKPNFSVDEMRRYLSSIPHELLEKITLGTHTFLSKEFDVGGIHHTSNTNEDACDGLRCSRSCHSVKEVDEYSSNYDYVFLSPIFDSISKTGYNSKFDKDALMEYSAKGYLNKVVALGGVNGENIAIIKDLGFYGAAFLGYLFGDITDQELNKRLSIIKSLK